MNGKQQWAMEVALRAGKVPAESRRARVNSFFAPEM
jgi:hypothetical protein